MPCGVCRLGVGMGGAMGCVPAWGVPWGVCRLGVGKGGAMGCVPAWGVPWGVCHLGAGCCAYVGRRACVK